MEDVARDTNASGSAGIFPAAKPETKVARSTGSGWDPSVGTIIRLRHLWRPEKFLWYELLPLEVRVLRTIIDG